MPAEAGAAPRAASSPAGMKGEEELIFSEHIEVGQMGEHLREIRFESPVWLRSVHILGRNERPFPDSSFEGITFPNVLAMSLNIYAADLTAGSSTMPRLSPVSGSTGVFAPPGDGFLTDCIVCRGEFLRLSVAIFGQRPDSDPPVNVAPDMVANLPPYLRPSAPFDSDRLDLAPSKQAGEAMAGAAALAAETHEVEAAYAAAPAALPRALGLSGASDVDARIAKHGAWVASLVDEPDGLDIDTVVERLGTLAADFATLAQCAPCSGADQSTQGPVVARHLLNLISRCVSRLEFRPLRASLNALAATLCLAPTAAEVLRKGGLAKLLGILRDADWCQLGHKIAALQAVAQLCTHAVGMEALLGWSTAQEASTGATSKPVSGGTGLPDHVTGYDLVLALVEDAVEPAGPGSHRELEPLALTLLRHAAFYVALARLDSACARLADSSADASVSEGAVPSVVQALGDIAAQLMTLSTANAEKPTAGGNTDIWPGGGSLIEEEDPLGSGPASMLLLSGGITTDSAASGDVDPFARAHPRLHGFMESFMAGRRLLPNLNIVLKRMPRLLPQDRLAIFAPVRRLLLAILACNGGARFLASDSQALNILTGFLDGSGSGGKCTTGDVVGVGLPPVPSYPWALGEGSLSAPQLAALISLHVRASRLVLAAVARTRRQGHDGLLSEADALPLLSALYQLCARSSAGAAGVVSTFRSVFLVEWLLRQLEGRLDEQSPAGSVGGTPLPSIRHLIAILYTLVLRDPTASLAEKFGARILGLANRTLEHLEGAGSGEGADVNGWGRGSSLEFALDSDESLGKAVRVGRRSADSTSLSQLRELVAQLEPWKKPTESDGQIATEAAAICEAVPTARLLACARMGAAPPRRLKQSTREERGHQLELLLGGYTASDLGVEVAEVDFVGEDADDDRKLNDERRPSGALTELPLLAVRLLCRRARESAREALAIEVAEAGSRDASARDGLGSLVPIFVRCSAALGINLEALIVQEESETAAAVYETQYAHGCLLEAALQTCYYVLRGLREANVGYRQTELLHSLHLLVDRLLGSLAGLLPAMDSGADPEFRLLWRHCLVWLCRVFRAWVELDPSAAAGQLLQPLLRHTRVLPIHYAPGLVLLATCGNLEAILPAVTHSFAVMPGKVVAEAPNGEQSLASRPVLLPVSARGGAAGHLVMRVAGDSGKTSDRAHTWGQLWDMDSEEGTWDAYDGEGGELAATATQAGVTRDPLVAELRKRPQTASMAAALDLVNRVGARRERLLLDDLAETLALVTQCAVTSNAVLHHIVVRVLEKLTLVSIPVLEPVLRLANNLVLGGGDGSASPEPDRADASTTWASASFASDGNGILGGSRKTVQFAQVLRLLLLLRHFGERSAATRRALAEHHVDALCLALLAHDRGPLPPAALTQAVRLLGLVLCPSGCADAGDEGVSLLSIPKQRMATKALSLLVNRSQAEDPQALIGASAVAAVLELLLRLGSVKSSCLNLLFSPAEEGALTDAGEVPVTLSCAFRLGGISNRLSAELASADDQWSKAQRNSEAEADAEEILFAWLRVAQLLVELCAAVAASSPTSSVFLAVVLPTGTAVDAMDDAQLRHVLSDISEVLARITKRQKSEPINALSSTVQIRFQDLHSLLAEMKRGPTPATLPRAEMDVSAQGKPAAPLGSAAPDVVAPTGNDADEVLSDLVDVFEGAEELERNPDWLSAAEMDPTVAPAVSWAFDAVACRKRRQDLLEKLESDRQAKRQKAAPPRAVHEWEPAAKRPRESEKAPEASRQPGAADGTSTATAATTNAAGAAAPTAASPAATAGSPPSAGAAGDTPETSGGNADAGAKSGATGPAEALQSFLKDHPQFMRVLQNPKKCFSDPRKKSMFVKELKNYPVVRAFLETKGLKFD